MGGGGSQKTFIQPFGPQFGLKIRGGGGPGPSPGSTTETSGKINQGEKCFQSNLPHRCS